MIQIVRIEDGLPEGFEALRREAAAEGFRHVERLAVGYASGAMRFDGEGEALFGAVVDGELAAVGGVTRDEENPGLDARRMRRLYVRPAYRRRGVGRALAGAMIQQAMAAAPLATVNAGTPDAPAFWEAMGFAPAHAGGRVTHALARE